MNNSDTNGELQGSRQGRCEQPAMVMVGVEVQRRTTPLSEAMAFTCRPDPE
jgi:hypothetical protein